jgi:hypothetical protein
MRCALFCGDYITPSFPHGFAANLKDGTITKQHLDVIVSLRIPLFRR